MIRRSRATDERRESGALECWLLHGAVGLAADWRSFTKRLAEAKTGTCAVDLWRFLECAPMPLADFGAAFNADAGGEVSRGGRRALLGYSMGGRLALHALLQQPHPWQAAVIISAHPGLEIPAEREARRAADAEWAAMALTAHWPDFLAAWDAQPVLASSAIRAPQTSGGLAMRRREMARSFVDWSLGNQEPLWTRLCEIKVPVLWVAGENDPKFLELAHRAVAEISTARLSIAPNAGHRVPWEAEAWLAEEVAGFLNRGS